MLLVMKVGYLQTGSVYFFSVEVQAFTGKVTLAVNLLRFGFGMDRTFLRLPLTCRGAGLLGGQVMERNCSTFPGNGGQTFLALSQRVITISIL